MANKSTREREIAAAKVKVYDKKKKELKILGYVALACAAVSLILMFVPFIDIYNDPARSGGTDAGFVEIGASGFDCLISAITRDYTNAERQLAPFYFWVTTQNNLPYVKTMAICALIAVLATVIAIVAQIMKIATGKNDFILFSGLCEFIAFVVCTIAFVSAFSCEDVIIAGYCNGNPNCYIRSFAIVPAIAALAAFVADAIHFVKNAAIKNAAKA